MRARWSAVSTRRPRSACPEQTETSWTPRRSKGRCASEQLAETDLKDALLVDEVFQITVVNSQGRKRHRGLGKIVHATDAEAAQRAAGTRGVLVLRPRVVGAEHGGAEGH